MNSLRKKYNKEIAPKLMKQFEHSNIHAVAKIEKVCLNVGISQSRKEPNYADDIFEDIKMITGQAPVVTKAKKAISGFKIRQNQNVGVAVTLRGERMWDFIERLVSAALPRIRDFQGIDLKNFDKQGNLNYPVKEQLVFPEISHDDIKTIFGMQINIRIVSREREESIELLRLLGFPLKKEASKNKQD